MTLSRRKLTTRPPVQRMAWFNQQVRAGRYPTACDLAKEFEISERTARSDIGFLRDRMGAPLQTRRPQGGYYYTDPDFKLLDIKLTQGELVAIFLAERALREQAGSPLELELRSAFEKICLSLPEELTISLDQFEEAISFVGGPVRAVELETFRQAVEAVRNRRRLRMRYYTASRGVEGEREVDPHHLHNYAGDWYLIAYDLRSDQMKDFALSRIRGLWLTGETFTPRSDFDRRAYIAAHFGGFMGDTPVEVIVRFDAYQARWMREKPWPGETDLEEHADGSLTLHLTVTNLEGVQRWVMQYGSHATVLAPPELRTAIAAEAQKMAQTYGISSIAPGG